MSKVDSLQIMLLISANLLAVLSGFLLHAFVMFNLISGCDVASDGRFLMVIVLSIIFAILVK